MTVAELIQKLQNYPSDDRVLAECMNSNADIVESEDFNILHRKGKVYVSLDPFENGLWW